MKKRMFLTGPEACGKTALISGAVGSEIRRSGGLILRHTGGALEISAAATGERRVFANAGPELAGYCAALLAEAAGAPFAGIDGLGGAGLAEPGGRPVQPGQAVSVYIKSILPDKMKVKLAILSLLDTPALPAVPEYFVSEGHIGRWVYSTPGSKRLVETVIDSEE